jgi:hypothetical protein
LRLSAWLKGGSEYSKRHEFVAKILLPFYDFDVPFAILGIVLSLLMVILGGFSSGKVAFLLVGILIFISCLLWFAIRKKELLTFHLPTSGTWVKFWAICFFILYMMSIVALYLRPNLYERPISYFVLTAFMASVIALESLSAGRRHVGLILVQILLLGMSIGWSQMLIFPGVNGTDAWYHSKLIQRILYENHIPDGFSYSKLPILHLLVGITSFITALPIKLAAVATVSFAQIACNAVFIYLIARSFFRNHQIGLLSALLVIIGDHHIRFTYLLYPNAFGMAFLVIALYLMFNKAKKMPQLIFSILFMLLSVTIITTHSILSIFTAILLFSAWCTFTFHSKIYQQSSCYIRLLVPISFTVVMSAWWTYLSMHTSQLGNLISIDFDPEILAMPALHLGDVNIDRNIADIAFSIFPVYLFAAISLIGVLYMISQKGNSSTFTYAFLSISPLVVAFIFFISGRTVLIERWFYFAQVLLSIPLSLVTYWLGTLTMKRSTCRRLVFFLFMAVFSFLMITSAMGNHDNNSFPPEDKVMIYHTHSELAGYDFFVDRSTGTLSIDGNSIRTFTHYYNWENYQRLDLSYTSGEFNHDGTTKLLRHGIIHDLQRMGALSPSIQTDIYRYVSDLGFNKIYENSGLVGYF